MTKGRVSLARGAMGAAAPSHEPALLDAAHELLEPVRRRLEEADLAGLPPPVPAFDPLAAAGERTWRPVPLPAPPPGTVPDVPPPGSITRAPAADLAALVRAGELTAAEVYAAFAERIRLLNPEVNAYLTVLPGDPGSAGHPDGAARPDGPLAGVPVGLKDLIDTAGIRTTCAACPAASTVA